jgi:hypothetical protein
VKMDFSVWQVHLIQVKKVKSAAQLDFTLKQELVSHWLMMLAKFVQLVTTAMEALLHLKLVLKVTSAPQAQNTVPNSLAYMVLTIQI